MPEDLRNVRTGWEIPSERYSDQPYVVKTDDGAWLCVMTTGGGLEGQPGQHVVTTRSTDTGQTWDDLVDVEPADGPEASYAVLLKAPGGRVYCFYNHNTDNRRWVIADDPPYKDGKCYRVDSQGYFVFKYSDDHGRTWSAERYNIPIREMEIDRQNAYGGEVQFFWNVGRPFVHDGAAYVSVHKVGGFGHGFFTRSEGVLLKSDNILTESDPARIRWETLPDGEAGLRTPPGGGSIAEEQSYSVLSDGSFYCVYRSVDGHPVYAYSRNGGHTWTEPQYKRYANGRLMKHPRAANFAWKCDNGHFLYWFHNHGGNWYEDRNPVWLCGGVEVETPAGRVIQWSQPEIVLYDDDTYIRMSYPDLVEEDGQYYLTETQKDYARVHPVDRALVEGLWHQFDEAGTVAKDGCVLELTGDLPLTATIPALPAFTARDSQRADHGMLALRNGFTVELWLQLDRLAGDQTLLDTRSHNGQGWCLRTTSRGTVEIILNDGRTESRWDCDPDVLRAGTRQHLVVVVDGGPRTITFIVDGVLCDGGTFRQFGWGRFNPYLRHVNSADVNRVIAPGSQGGEEISPGQSGDDAQTIQIAPNLQGCIQLLRVYDRYLRTSEAIGNYKAGL
jgi:hypothetical protein